MLLLFGFLPGIDGTAHAVGLVAGIGLGWLCPEGVPSRRWQQKAWTSGALVSMAAILTASALTLATAREQPYQLENDAAPRRFLFLQVENGAPFGRSGQKQAFDRCLKLGTEVGVDPTQLDPALNACELAIRALPLAPGPHLMLSLLLKRDQQPERAKRQEGIGRRLGGEL